MKREGVPACEPAGESWWCRLKERMDYLWDRASACILTINHKTPDGDGDFAITGGDGITVTDEDNGIRIEATITEETVEGIVGQETMARQQADQALQADIDAEEQARVSADNALRADIDTRATQTALDAEEAAREQADQALQSTKLDRNQGTGNSGKVLIVGGDGIVKPGTSTASVAWGGISGELADQTDLSDALAGKADDADVVHRTGSETISGSKVFTSNIKIKKSNPQLINQSTEIDIDNPPTSWTRLQALYGSDSKNRILHSISGGVNGSTVNMDIVIATMRAGALVSDGLRIYATPDITYATAPDIPGTSTDKKIVNAASLNQWPSIVRTVGNQSIAGVKTFTQTPQAPTPAESAAGMEIVTAAWFRDRIAEMQTLIEALTYHGSDADKSVLRLDNITAGDLISLSISTAYNVPMVAVPSLDIGGSYALPNTGTINSTIFLKRDNLGYYLDAGTYIYNETLIGTRIRLGNASTEVTQ